MIKKTVEYLDFNGKDRVEDFYFNMTEAEIAEMSFSVAGGMDKKLEQIIAEKDEKAVIEHFKEIVLASYGVKSDDGKQFIKSKEVRDAFMYSAAFSHIFMELGNDDKAAAAFINGVLPKAPQDHKESK